MKKLHKVILALTLLSQTALDSDVKEGNVSDFSCEVREDLKLYLDSWTALNVGEENLIFYGEEPTVEQKNSMISMVKEPVLQLIINEEVIVYDETFRHLSKKLDLSDNQAFSIIERMEAVREIYYLHMRQLMSMGIDIRYLKDFNIALNYDDQTISTGGYYYSLDDHYNDYNFEEDTIVLLYPKNNYSFRRNLLYTYIHEFGHHIGFKYVHKDYDFEYYNQIRSWRVYIAEENYKWYPPEWRSYLHEQFAETYIELFIKKYKNASAAPNLDYTQTLKFKSLLKDSVPLSYESYELLLLRD